MGPFVDYDLRTAATPPDARPSWRAGDIPNFNVYRDNRVYITCQVDEDLPYILQMSARII